MTKPLWIFCFGLFSWISLSQAQIVISCRFKGVFHVEKIARYHLTYDEAKKTCTELDALTATKEQVETAHQAGFETCRYGWVENSTVIIPRLNSNPICAAGYIGVYVLQSNLTTPYDVYCYNASETSEKNCEQYDYKNKSVPSYDPTEEGDNTLSGKVSPTHPGQNLSSPVSEQGDVVEDSTTDPLMTTEQPEHSGDHGQLEPAEDVTDTMSPNLGDSGSDNTTESEGFIEVPDPNEADEDRGTTAEPSVEQATRSKNEEIHYGDHDEDLIDTNQDSTDDVKGGTAEESSDSIKNKSRRRAAVPEWLIVCVSLVCLGLIFSVCIALNARRICGQKKKLVINGNNKASPEDGVIMEQNGDTIKSQEMVQLVSRDQTSDLGEGDGPTQDDIRNSKDVDMRIGV
ncbi:CD44 antigen-like isoform 1-T1 [Leptodactylus fuscus]|uniref:CD44 antigen-like isoform X1 n=1 Tax=Leptodactylus fuscus TaxID=238119 RepID=UPI003F4E86E9